MPMTSIDPTSAAPTIERRRARPGAASPPRGASADAWSAFRRGSLPPSLRGVDLRGCTSAATTSPPANSRAPTSATPTSAAPTSATPTSARRELAGATLRGADLRGAKLGRADLSAATSSAPISAAPTPTPRGSASSSICTSGGALFTEARLDGARFERADLSGCTFHGVLAGARFDHAQLSGASLRAALLRRSSFVQGQIGRRLPRRRALPDECDLSGLRAAHTPRSRGRASSAASSRPAVLTAHS